MINEEVEEQVVSLVDAIRNDPTQTGNFDLLEIIAYLIRSNTLLRLNLRQLQRNVLEHEFALIRFPFYQKDYGRVVLDFKITGAEGS